MDDRELHMHLEEIKEMVKELVELLTEEVKGDESDEGKPRIRKRENA